MKPHDIRQGVTFGEIHSFRDWGLFLKERPQIEPPQVREYYVDVEGMNGQLDLTEALTGGVTYESRKGHFVFTTFEDRDLWAMAYSKILNALHGRRMQITLDEDREHFYIGRISVNKWTSNKYDGIIEIDAELDPFKYELVKSDEPWLWNPFNFRTGVIRSYYEIPIRAEGTNLTIIGSEGQSTPSIRSGASGVTATINGRSFTLNEGNNYLYGAHLNKGENQASFSGVDTTISISFPLRSL